MNPDIHKNRVENGEKREKITNFDWFWYFLRNDTFVFYTVIVKITVLIYLWIIHMSETIENPLEEKKEESVELKESANPSVEINKNEESANSQERKIDSQLVKKVLDYEMYVL